MFEKRPHRHPVQTFQFWFVVLCSFAVVTAWKLELFQRAPEVAEVEAIRALEENFPPPPELTQSEGPRQAATLSPQLEMVNAEAVPESQTVSLTPDQADQLPEGEQTLLRTALASDENQESQVQQTAFVRNRVEQTMPVAHRDGSSGVQNSMNLNAIQPASETEKQAPASKASSVSQENHASIDIDKIDRLIEAGDDIVALRICSEWYWTMPEQRALFIERLNRLASRIYFQPQPHYLEPYVVKFGEKIEDIAAKQKLTPQYLARLNRVDTKNVKTGTPLKVLNGPFSGVIDISDLELTIHAHGYVLIRIPIGLGEDVSLYPGNYKIGEKMEKPAYDLEQISYEGGDPKNPLGTHLLTLVQANGEQTDLALHGTHDNSLIGQVAGEGSVRMTNREIQAVIDLLIVGAEIVIKP